MGLQNVDKALLEAGSIDGIRNRFQELWYITLPSMKPMLLFGAVTQITASFSVGAISMDLCGFPSIEYSAHTLLLHAIDCAKQIDAVVNGDTVVIAAGIPLNTTGSTNLMRVAIVGKD